MGVVRANRLLYPGLGTHYACHSDDSFAPKLTQSPLSRRISRIDLGGISRERAFYQIAALAGVQIEIDRAALEDDGFQLGDPIDLHLRDVELRSALASLCLQENSCVILERPDGVAITTFAKLPTIVRIYDVNDLIDRWAASPYCGQNRTGGLADSFIDYTVPPEREDLSARLVKLIQSNLQSSVARNMAPIDEIVSISEGRVTVTGVEPVHRAVEQFLRRSRHGYDWTWQMTHRLITAALACAACSWELNWHDHRRYHIRGGLLRFRCRPVRNHLKPTLQCYNGLFQS